MTELEKTLSQIQTVDTAVYQRALERHATLTKPPGSLGRLEEVGARLAAVQGTVKPVIKNKAVAVFAADHGVTHEKTGAGVSAYPREVTAGMVHNFLAGGAAINALARSAGAELLVIDVGVDADFEPHPQLWQRKVARGTQNMLFNSAMTLAETAAALGVGLVAAQTLVLRGAELLAGGEMGIGNTTAAAALTAFFTGRSAAEVTGRGTGVDDAALARKISVVEAALAKHQDVKSPLDALASLGGLEIAALTGFYLGAAAAKTPVVLDGFISTAAALVAVAVKPAVKDYLFASHLSEERGHRVQLEALGLEPLFDLGLRLGEGTGAVLAFGLLEGAVATLAEMATFAEASL